MIYASIEEHWMRIQTMNSVAQLSFRATAGSDFRNRMTSSSDVFPFDGKAHSEMEKESCLVGMIMAWSAITLEAMVNLALANGIGNKTMAILAIEYPGDVLKRFQGGHYRSDLSKKVAILSDALLTPGNGPISEPVKIADKIALIRNEIVHDKPFELVDDGDGNVQVTNYATRKREADNKPRWLYHDLCGFYKECDLIGDHIRSCCPGISDDLEVIRFGSLWKD